MADQRTMAELLRAPTEGYAEAIVVSPILAEHFELKHSLINMMSSDQFFRLEKDNPHDHIRWFNKITSTIKYKDVPNPAIKLMLFPFSLARAARRWLEKEPPRFILTWEDLVSKFINEFFPPSRTTNLQNEISNFQQRFDESFHEAWDRYKDLLRACPHHGFTKLHQLDTFYNALNTVDQDSLNSTASGNLLERRTQDVLTIIKNKSKDNIQGYVSAAAVNYNQGNSGYHPPSVANRIRPSGFVLPNVQNNQNWFSQPQGYNRGNNFNQDTSYQASIQQNQVVPLSELEKIKKINKVNIKAKQTQINNVKNELRNEMQTSIQASMSNQTSELKNMMASFFQMNIASSSGPGSLLGNTIANPKGELKAITTRSGLVLDGPSVPMPPPFINPEEGERTEETLLDPKLAEYTTMVPPPLVQKAKPPSLRNYVMLKALLSNKEKLLELENTPLNENCSAVILKKLPEKLRDPEKFLIPCGFSEIKCKALADLANWAICTPAEIARDIFILVGKFTFPATFVVFDYESDPRVPLILRRPFIRTARALIDIHGEEMILRNSDERLTLNMRHDTSSYSNQPHKKSINMIDNYTDSYEDYLEDFFATNHLSGNPTFSSHTDLTSPKVINPLSGNTTSSSPDHLLEEFVDKLALITFPPRNDDLLFVIEFDLREIEYLLNHDPTKEMILFSRIWLMRVMDKNKGAKSKQDRTKPSTKRKA
nr:reverse transcriptase domain-containing protein [Tanacetum cinerariifolium]